ncbi:MAG: tripartite tricarboxylate transporter TctB family protein [Betaproteobacteria bacterium]|nr:tripartite tricarboxylate transporter TctB family protein [Betaproteobacteria bacterium]
MRFTIKNAQDFWCGVFFTAMGVLAIWLARDYPMGSALEMGPGYFPTWLGGIMIAFGLVIGALSLKVARADDEPAPAGPWAYRPWLAICGALVVFALLMDAGFGFVPSLFALIVGCALAHKDVRWGETLVLAVVLTAAAVAIFSYGLELPYRLFWWSH